MQTINNLPLYQESTTTNVGYIEPQNYYKDESSSEERAKQKFIAMMSHDLKTPLTAVMGFLDLLEMGIHGGEMSQSVTKGLNSSRASISRVINLVNDLLNYEQVNSGMMMLSLSRKPLMSLYEQALDSVALIAQLSRVTINFETTDLEIDCDPSRIVQVLVNLTANAIKFSERGGVVSIKAKQTNGMIEISVSDQGRGIPEEKLGSIFEPFVQVKSSDRQDKAGTGIGLTLCKLIVEAHGGEIGVDSKAGQGSRFWFRLPCKQ